METARYQRCPCNWLSCTQTESRTNLTKVNRHRYIINMFSRYANNFSLYSKYLLHKFLIKYYLIHCKKIMSNNVNIIRLNKSFISWCECLNNTCASLRRYHVQKWPLRNTWLKENIYINGSHTRWQLFWLLEVLQSTSSNGFLCTGCDGWMRDVTREQGVTSSPVASTMQGSGTADLVSSLACNAYSSSLMSRPSRAAIQLTSCNAGM